MESSGLKIWERVRSTLLKSLIILMALSGISAYLTWGFAGLVAAECSSLCLALGFWLTETLIAVFTQVKRANPAAIVLLFLGKLSWWSLLFFGIKYLPNGLDGAVAQGVGVFLLALVFSSIKHYGMPRISDGKPPSDP